MRNAVERVFGILKRRFPIIARILEYPFTTQVRHVSVLVGLHNFIRQKSPDTEIQDWEETAEERAKRFADEQALMERIPEEWQTPCDDNCMGQFRDKIAQDLWDSYIKIRTQRNQTI